MQVVIQLTGNDMRNIYGVISVINHWEQEGNRKKCLVLPHIREGMNRKFKISRVIFKGRLYWRSGVICMQFI